MKSINDLYHEAKQDENIRKEFLAAYEKGEIESFLKDNECNATIEDMQQFFEHELSSGSGKLSDEELSLVVGGKGDSKPSGQPKYQKGMKCEFFCPGGSDLAGIYEGKITDIREGCGQWEYHIMWPGGGKEWYGEGSIRRAWWG